MKELDNLYHAVSCLLTDMENMRGNYEEQTLLKVKEAMADVWKKNEKMYMEGNLKPFTTLRHKAGDKVIIKENTVKGTGHKFPIGSQVEITRLYPDCTPPHYCAVMGNAYWYINDHDIAEPVYDNLKINEE